MVQWIAPCRESCLFPNRASGSAHVLALRKPTGTSGCSTDSWSRERRALALYADSNCSCTSGIPASSLSKLGPDTWEVCATRNVHSEEFSASTIGSLVLNTNDWLSRRSSHCALSESPTRRRDASFERLIQTRKAFIAILPEQFSAIACCRSSSPSPIWERGPVLCCCNARAARAIWCATVGTAWFTAVAPGDWHRNAPARASTATFPKIRVKTTKKTDVAEHLEAFNHVGLLVNEPPSEVGLLFI